MGKTREPRAVTAQEFFAMELDGCGIAEAARECKLPDTTVRRVARGEVEPRASTLKPLETWSREQPAAQARGVYLSAIKTLGLEDVA